VAQIDPEFTAYPLQAMADAALEQAASLGATHGDFRAERIARQRLGLADGRLETLSNRDELGIAVRVDHVDASLLQVRECKFYSDGSTTAMQQRVRLNPGVTVVAVEPGGRFETMRTLAPSRPRPAGAGST
jgi:hypothetical protein